SISSRGDGCGVVMALSIAAWVIVNYWLISYGISVCRACSYFESGDKDEINSSQTRKIAQITSRY
ncbi:hypothetical protein NE645_18730, partial [Roseburia hominis]|nr:hypothetical protein [Roseburia hominis]